MCWGFIWGLIIGTCIGFLVMGVISAGRDDRDYIELNHYEENENNKEVEE